MSAPTVLILAAGHGTRMKSRVPKVLHPICGRPMGLWPVVAAREANAGRIVVVGSPDEPLAPLLPGGVEHAVQPQANGTGGAVIAAAGHIGRDDTVLVLQGDVPLITADEIAELAKAHDEQGAQATVATMVLDDPAQYGRVIRRDDGTVERIVEAKAAAGDATSEQLAINEVNTGVYAFAGGPLLDALDRLTPDNAQGELYLPDVLPLLESVVAHVVDDPGLTLGVNDRVDLVRVRALAQRRIHEAHMRNGVTIVNPDATLIDVDVRLGQDTVVEPSSFLRGTTSAGEGCTIGPLATLIDTSLGDGVTVVSSHLDRADVHDRVTVGPFAYLRPDAVLMAGAKAGTFVEIKNSTIGPNTKVPHLSYIGDADIGEDTNVGAGTITANYDGFAKHRTTIGARVRISVDTAFVAPVTVGDDAVTGAGSVITDDVPPGALGIARSRQRNVDGYADRRRKPD
ncbi:MAG TPA: bifunctional UDP-N-acetylglucosamine diphosphorylase/glucosamine-1-phosphate N-acetyltransferase GlmU [Solirubrobacteraceae bacterium]